MKFFFFTEWCSILEFETTSTKHQTKTQNLSETQAFIVLIISILIAYLYKHYHRHALIQDRYNKYFF